jgi:Protein of unknown function (DUF998)
MNPSTRRLALFGAVGPVLFVAIAIVMTVLEWDFLHRLGWHLVQDSSVPYPSSTAMGPYGLLQTFNFIQVGLSVMATAVGLWRTVQPRPRVGIGFVFLGAVAMLLAMFTTDGTTNQPTTWHGLIHGLAFVLLLRLSRLLRCHAQQGECEELVPAAMITRRLMMLSRPPACFTPPASTKVTMTAMGTAIAARATPRH